VVTARQIDGGQPRTAELSSSEAHDRTRM